MLEAYLFFTMLGLSKTYFTYVSPNLDLAFSRGCKLEEFMLTSTPKSPGLCAF